MTRILLGWPAFLLVALTIQGGAIFLGLREDAAHPAPMPGYLFGDAGIYAAAADSLLKDGDLDLLNQCYPGRATITEAIPDGLEGEHAGEFGLSADGKLTIKQSPLLSVAALPFRAILGWPGFLLFNLLVLNLLLVGLVELAGGTPAARVVVLMGFLGTALWRYTYNFSPDLFLCGLLVGSLLAARANRPMLAGVLTGLAVSTKVYVVALMLPVPFVVGVAAGDRRWSALLRFVLGGVLGLAPGLVSNTWLFGAPWITGYERQLAIRGGEVGLADHTSRFTVPPLFGLRKLLFDSRAGMMGTAPIWFLWPIAAAILLLRARTRLARAWIGAAVAVILLNLAVFAMYDGWDGGSGYGNRYQFPGVALAVTLVAAAVSEQIGRREPTRSCKQPAVATQSSGSAGRTDRSQDTDSTAC